jgi:hypothetical protein
MRGVRSIQEENQQEVFLIFSCVFGVFVSSGGKERGRLCKMWTGCVYDLVRGWLVMGLWVQKGEQSFERLLFMLLVEFFRESLECFPCVWRHVSQVYFAK